MNIFRLVADLLHLVSFLLLINKIRSTKNCTGLSLKTQEAFLVVFLSRYWDLFLYFVSVYNTCMKLFFISATAYTIYLMKVKRPYCLTYEPACDDFQHRKILYPVAAILALLFHTKLTLFEMSWSFSIWLEAIAILPQLRMLTKMKDVENLTSHYMATLGMYRLFYLMHWVYSYHFSHHMCWTSTLGGVVQTALYADFLYYYVISLRKQQTMIV